MVDTPEALDAARATRELARVLESQYHAALAMLRDAIEQCPDELWFDTRPRNAFWQVAYHALFFAHLYVGQDVDSFVRWAEHQRDNQNEDGIAGEPDPASTLPLIPTPYTKEQALRYWAIVDGMIDATVDGLDLRRRDCGFPWYKMTKLEHEILSIRHLQHHTAQLLDRLRAARDVGIRWVGKGPAAAGSDAGAS
jgi:hypothetical protein